MASINRRELGLKGGAAFLLANGLLVAPPAVAQAQAQAAAQAARNRVVFQVTENDPVRWNIILNNMQNLRDGVGSEGVDIELVAYGPGVLMLKADSSARQRVAEAVKSGVKANACQNTMNAMKLLPADMLPEASYVPSGVVEVMRKQQQGWAYIRS